MRDDGVAYAPRGRKVWALLAHLVRQPAGISRTQLASLLFEDAEDPLAAVRWNLSELRRLLGIDGLRGETLVLSLDPAIHVDVDVVTRGTWSEALAVAELDRPLLEGMSFPTSPSYDVWLATERRHLQATSEAVLREAAFARLATGAAADAADLASRLVRSNPLDENFQSLLVRSLAAAGDGVGAARQAAACRELFLRELGVLPGATLDAAVRTSTAAAIARPAIGRPAVIAQLDAGEAAIGAGSLDAGLQCLRRAIADADALADTLLGARARLALGSALVHAARGRDEEGATALHEVLAVGRDRAPSLAAAASRELGYVEVLSGRYDRALAWLESATALAADDRDERARIATVHGIALSDVAQYAAAASLLQDAEAHANASGDVRRIAYVLSMRGRMHLLRGELDEARPLLDRSIELAQQVWTAIVPWPQSLRAEIDLLGGDIDSASERFDHAFALGCQLDDPCWEGISSRGRGMVAAARGRPDEAIAIFADGLVRCVRVPDAYLWGKAYLLDALCGVALARAMPRAAAWIDELSTLASRTGMRELVVRAHLHRCALGDAPSRPVARLLAGSIDNPALKALADAVA